MSLVKSDGSLYQWQFVRCSKKVKRDLSVSLFPSFHESFFFLSVDAAKEFDELEGGFSVNFEEALINALKLTN